MMIYWCKEDAHCKKRIIFIIYFGTVKFIVTLGIYLLPSFHTWLLFYFILSGQLDVQFIFQHRPKRMQ